MSQYFPNLEPGRDSSSCSTNLIVDMGAPNVVMLNATCGLVPYLSVRNTRAILVDPNFGSLQFSLYLLVTGHALPGDSSCPPKCLLGPGGRLITTT